MCVCTDLKELLCVSFGDSERVAYTKFSPVEVMVLLEKPHCSFDNETPLLNGIARRNVPSLFSVPLSFSLSLSHSQVHAHTFLPLYPHTCPEPCCLVALPLALTPSSSPSSRSLPDLSHTLSLDHGRHTLVLKCLLLSAPNLLTGSHASCVANIPTNANRACCLVVDAGKSLCWLDSTMTWH